jgi:hypothetical protein
VVEIVYGGNNSIDSKNTHSNKRVIHIQEGWNTIWSSMPKITHVDAQKS